MDRRDRRIEFVLDDLGLSRTGITLVMRAGLAARLGSRTARRDREDRPENTDVEYLLHGFLPAEVTLICAFTPPKSCWG
jgi:hypothetical protein